MNDVCSVVCVFKGMWICMWGGRLQSLGCDDDVDAPTIGSAAQLLVTDGAG